MSQTEEVRKDQAIKAKHRAMWASGDYARVAHEMIPDLGSILVQACGVGPGDRVLDIGAGSGNAAIPAALIGAKVVASDLTPELLEIGRREAEALGAALEWRKADAEALPFEDDGFDTVMSCVGIMFAPNHEASAEEVIRVCRPGGTIGLLSWTPEGFVGQMLATMRPYAPPPPTGAQPPPLWGMEEHVTSLLGDRVTEVVTRRQTVRVSFETPEEFRDYFKAHYGPTIAVYKNIAEEPERVSELDQNLVDLARKYDQGDGSLVMDWEYLLLTAQKRA